MSSSVVGSSASDGIKTFSISTTSITPRSQLRGGTGGAAECVRFNHNGQVLVGAGTSGVITLWHTNGTVLGELSRKQDQGKTIRALSFSSGSRYLATGGDDAIVKVWDLKRREVIRTFRGHTSGVACVEFSKDADKYVASGDSSGNICLFNVLTGRLTTTFTSSPTSKSTSISTSISTSTSTSVRSVSFSPFSRNILTSAHEDGVVRVWDIQSSSSSLPSSSLTLNDDPTNSNALVAEFQGAHDGAVTAICCSPFSTDICVSVGNDKRLNVYDLRTKEVVRTARADTPLSCCEHFTDGNRVVVGTTRGELMIYDIRRMGQHVSHPISRITAHGRASITSVQVQPGVSGSSNNNGDSMSDTASVRSEQSVRSIRSERSERSVASRSSTKTKTKTKTNSIVSNMPRSVSVFDKHNTTAGEGVEEREKESERESESTSKETQSTHISSIPLSRAIPIEMTTNVTPPIPSTTPLSPPPAPSTTTDTSISVLPITSSPSSSKNIQNDIESTPISFIPTTSPNTDEATIDQATSLEEQIRNLLGDTKSMDTNDINENQTNTITNTSISTSRRGVDAGDPGTSNGNLSIDIPPSSTTTIFDSSAPVPSSSSSSIHRNATTTIKATKVSSSRIAGTQNSNDLREMVEEIMTEHRTEIKSDIQNVHVELLRQFQLQIVSLFWKK